MKFITAVVAALLLLATGRASAQDERILSFDSQITVHPDGWITVKESIRVRSAAREIRRGIYRDFPTQYRDRWGWRVAVPLEVLSVLRDGRQEPFRIERRSNGRRIYIGDPNYYLGASEYNYTLVYRTSRQVGFFPDHDELYWNVTGSGWAFPIDRASASVVLPRGIPHSAVKLEGYTGAQGEKGQDYSSVLAASGTAHFRATRPLEKSQGLTIIVSWPKGYVRQPTDRERIEHFLDDNRMVVTAATGIALVLIYYGLIWLWRGRDPARGTQTARLEPPEGVSAAAVRYLSRMGYDQQCLTAGIMGMAAKGYLSIAPNGGGGFTLTSLGRSNEPLSDEEAAVARVLFTDVAEVEIGGEYSDKAGRASSALKSVLEERYRGCFRRNEGWVAGGFFLSFFTFIAAGIPGFPNGWVMLALGVILGGINVFFYFANRAYTPHGRALMDQIEAFRRYLSGASGRLAAHEAGEANQDVYEKLSPFAVALGVQEAWHSQFQAVMRKSATSRHGSDDWDTIDRSHRWRTGCSTAFSASFSEAISSSATPPGSSSGGNGGGSSGGGGGGGGGGGW